MIINSPCNPTGAVIDPEELLVIGDMAQRRRFTMLFDDTYSQLVYTRWDVSSLQALRDAVGDRLVILGTTSKTYCMTGFRVGWVLGPRGLVDACAALASHSTQSPATFCTDRCGGGSHGTAEGRPGSCGRVQATAGFRALGRFVRSRSSRVSSPRGGSTCFPTWPAT